MTETAQRAYITQAVAAGILPKDAHRMAEIVSLDASVTAATPIQFWQLYSVLGQDPILRIVSAFYERVFADEPWFTSVFERVGGVDHHINTQASMWIDVMGGGPYYHGAEFRLSFHHTHNAIRLMTDAGAARWATLMRATLDDIGAQVLPDPRMRPSLNTFLTHFMGKYAAEFGFADRLDFGPTNPAIRRKLDFRTMTEAQISALPEDALRAAFAERGIDLARYPDKAALVAKALML